MLIDYGLARAARRDGEEPTHPAVSYRGEDIGFFYSALQTLFPHDPDNPQSMARLPDVIRKLIEYWETDPSYQHLSFNEINYILVVPAMIEIIRPEGRLVVPCYAGRGTYIVNFLELNQGYSEYAANNNLKE